MNESLAFREFVARTIDRPAIVADVLADRVPVLNTVVGMSWPAASASAWSGYTVDEAVQVELLATAIEDLEPTSATVDFATSTSLERTQIAGALLQRLGAAGLTVDIELLELGEFFRDRVLTGAFDIGEWAWRATPGPVGAVADLEARFSTLPENDGYNFYRWGADGSAELLVAGDLNSRITALDGILDLDDLRDRLAEIDGLLAENVVIVPMYAVPNAAAVWEASFDGFEHVAAFPDTWNAAFWRRSTG
jgi:ABC-type transport system substrate-binding protein